MRDEEGACIALGPLYICFGMSSITSQLLPLLCSLSLTNRLAHQPLASTLTCAITTGRNRPVPLCVCVCACMCLRLCFRFMHGSWPFLSPTLSKITCSSVVSNTGLFPKQARKHNCFCGVENSARHKKKKKKKKKKKQKANARVRHFHPAPSSRFSAIERKEREREREREREQTEAVWLCD